MRKLIILTIVLSLAAIVGCNGKVKSYQISIQEIKKYPEKFREKECIVEGYVTSVVDLPLIEHDAFKVHDGTGNIWIYTIKGVPPERVKVRVKGLLKKFVEIPLGIKTEIDFYIELNEMKYL